MYKALANGRDIVAVM